MFYSANQSTVPRLLQANLRWDDAETTQVVHHPDHCYPKYWVLFLLTTMAPQQKKGKQREDQAAYRPRLTEAEKRERARVASAAHYRRHPEVREKKRLLMRELRAARKLARRQWDPPKRTRILKLLQQQEDEVMEVDEEAVTLRRPNTGISRQSTPTWREQATTPIWSPLPPSSPLSPDTPSTPRSLPTSRSPQGTPPRPRCPEEPVPNWSPLPPSSPPSPDTPSTARSLPSGGSSPYCGSYGGRVSPGVSASPVATARGQMASQVFERFLGVQGGVDRMWNNF
ncbi:hypothetical protein C8F04DRAFT_1188046 [Mycena alexandri]|uniref:Uncharacterized protein n=1 Tax=Mycena alexandri TaxID=1745969 RepID=A0AAD6SNV2_9AGAR|nr:hypothetical protein C8F04DRAFT_1188046 [Mycena alexandri]